jgi:hypothetical protein
MEMSTLTWLACNLLMFGAFAVAILNIATIDSTDKYQPLKEFYVWLSIACFVLLGMICVNRECTNIFLVKK